MSLVQRPKAKWDCYGYNAGRDETSCIAVSDSGLPAQAPQYDVLEHGMCFQAS